MPQKPKIGITMGDPNGVGPEIVLKSVNDLQIKQLCEPVVYGSKSVLKKAGLETGLSLGCEIVDTGSFRDDQIRPGLNDKSAGEASLKYIERAVGDAIKNKIQAVVTAPISKESIHLSGSEYPGHTEMLKDLTGAKEAVMLFDGGPFRVALVTIHVSLIEAVKLIKRKKILTVIRICNEELRNKFNIKNPKIAVCGLNPHAGEGGAFGDEEIKEISPAVKEGINEGIDVSGPIPADTLFYRANRGEWDLVLAMYHDQGLIPFKMVAFDTGVNVTLGLPIVRTSPDHGTAFDISWKGLAKPLSMIEAIKLAVKLT